LVLWGLHGIVDSPYWKNDMAVEFWLVAAIGFAAVQAISSPLRGEVARRAGGDVT
jgi:hypothetical protein